jgi:phosphoribosyl-AMP cyclohydrolase
MFDDLKYDADGLIPAVIQDDENGEVLMVAYMNRDSLASTVATGKTHFWSRSRKKYWLKGESSGHTQEVRAIHTDCDKDCLLIRVKQNVAACHEGYRSCFFRSIREGGASVETTEPRLESPEHIYGSKV